MFFMEDGSNFAYQKWFGVPCIWAVMLSWNTWEYQDYVWAIYDENRYYSRAVMIYIGKDLWRSSCQISCAKHSHITWSCGSPCPTKCWASPRMEITQLPWVSAPLSPPSQHKNISLYLIGISHVANCACCYLLYHFRLLRRVFQGI